MHRLQHLVLHHLGPFFIALSYPGAALRAGIPFAWRQRFVRPAAQSKPARVFFDIVFNPVVAVVLFVGLIYFWLLSPIHFKAMLDARLYRVMNWNMVIDGLLFWWLVLDPRPAPPARLAPGRRILVVIAAIPPQILLGAYIFFTPHELYPIYSIYSICGRAFTWITPMRDQQIGGLLLWIPGSMMSVIGALIALRHWLRLSARARLQTERKRPAHAGPLRRRRPHEVMKESRGGDPHVRNAVLVVNAHRRHETERAIKLLQIRLRMQADGIVRPMSEDVFEHGVAELQATELRGRQHAADAHVLLAFVRKVWQQDTQITRQRGPRLVLTDRTVSEQMPRIEIEPVDIAVHAILFDDEHRAASGEHVVDLSGHEIAEALPAPFDIGESVVHVEGEWRALSRNYAARIARKGIR